MSSDGRHKSPWVWRTVAFFVAAVGGLGFLIWFMSSRGLEESDQWASVLGAVLGYIGAVAAPLIWMMNRAGRTAEVDEEAALVRLREAVRGTWTREVAARSLHLPRPIRLHWRPTTRPSVQVASDRGPRTSQRQGSLVTDDGAPPGAVLVDIVADPGLRQVVIVGEPGAGKSTLTILYVVAAVTTDEERDAVPVPLSAAGWDPTRPDGVEGWIIQQICQDYPQLRPVEADQLVRRRRVIPVLDGLDEMPPGVRSSALERLEEAVGAGLRAVVTCRTDEFAEATGEVGALPQAVVLEIEPVDPEDAATYLTDRETLVSTRWDQVTTALRTDRDGPIATALSTPLMISLARQVYQRPQSRPGELAGLDDPDAVQQQLLSRFLPSVYGADRADRAGRWLAFLIRRLAAGPTDPDLRWWRLGQTLPRWLLIASITAVSTALGLFYGLIVGVVIRDIGLLPWLLLFGITSFFLGLIGSLHTARVTSPEPPRPSRWSGLRDIALGIGDIYLAAAVMSGIGTIVILAQYLGAPAADAVSVGVVDILGSLSPLSIATILALIGVSHVLVYRLGSGRAGLPRRSTPDLRALSSHLVPGLGVGLLFGVPVAFVGLADIGVTPRGALISAGVTTAFIAVVLSVGRWLNSPVTDTQHSLSPRSVLAADRTALLATVGGVIVAVTLCSAAALGAFDIKAPPAVILAMGFGLASLTGNLVLAGSASAWLLYSVARISFALRRQLPWRLMGFLRDAHHSGVLRQAGAAYQIRHDLVRSHIADRWAASPIGVTTRPSPGPDPVPGSGWKTARRRIAVIVVATVVLAALPITARLSDPRAFVYLGESWADPVFSSDGRVVATLSESGTIHLWDGQTGRTRAETTVRISRRGPMAFSHLAMTADGSRVTAVDGLSEEVLTLDTRTNTESHLVDVGRVVALAQDGQTLAVDSGQDGFRLWNPFTGWSAALDDDPHRELLPYGPPSAFSPDGRTLVAVAIGSWQLWDVRSRKPIGAPKPTTAGINEPAFSADGRLLVTSELDDGTVSLWDTGTGSEIHRVVTDRDGEADLMVSPDGQMVAINGFGEDLKVWDPSTGGLVATIHGIGRYVAFRPGGQTLAVVRGGGHLRLYNPDASRVAVPWIDQAQSGFFFNSDGTRLLTRDDEFRVRLWDLTSRPGRRHSTRTP
ncbi:NACHT domain-containing protein [Micromonospora sp. NPDC051543]|uniref:NACHT domain-containing protein n=1 Tax=Micromonospora sp. NPDC051543 TaxID=3364287 RepID=UPI0037BB2FFF